MEAFLEIMILDTDGYSVSVADLGIVILVLLGGGVFSWLAHLALSAIADRSRADSVQGAIIHALDGPIRWAILVLALWVSWQQITHKELTEALSSGIFLATQLPFLMWFGARLTDNWTAIWAKRASATEGTFDDQLVPVVRTLLRLLIVILGLLLILQNLGYQVGTLVAGLGIGGAAIALASKDTIANLFGSIVIFVDRPFQVGDWVEIGAQEGTVEEVGLRVTRIRTFANSLITVPNSALTTTSINNWSKMQKRRIKLTLGVTYDATPEQLEQAVAALRDVLEGDARVSQDFMLINFTNFGASSLEIFVYAFTLTTRWDEYMQVRQDLLLEFMRRFQALGLSFAFPSQSVYIESLPPGFPEAMMRETPR